VTEEEEDNNNNNNYYYIRGDKAIAIGEQRYVIEPIETKYSNVDC
jgi:hypothetical protein